jgi:hypothetical protein
MFYHQSQINARLSRIEEEAQPTWQSPVQPCSGCRYNRYRHIIFFADGLVRTFLFALS